MVKSRPYVILSAAISLDGKLGVKNKRTKLSSKNDKIRVHKLRSIVDAIIIGKNTVSAVRSGFFWGYVGLINNIIELIKKETNKTFKVIVTGGFANLFVNALRQKATIDKDITLKGLIKSAKLNSL